VLRRKSAIPSSWQEERWALDPPRAEPRIDSRARAVEHAPSRAKLGCGLSLCEFRREHVGSKLRHLCHITKVEGVDHIDHSSSIIKSPTELPS